MTTATAELLAKKIGTVEAAATELSAVADLSTLAVLSDQIKSLDQEDAAVDLKNLIESEGLNDFRLGGILALYQLNSDWWDGAETFKAFVNTGTVIPLHYRKVMYLIKIYNCLVDNNIPWETVKSIGWTKLRELVNVLTAENVDDWVAKAEVLTTLQLQAAVKAFLKPEKDDGETSDVTTMTFKLHEDQKEQVRMALDKAKADLNTEVDTVALEGICTSFLGGTFDISALAAEHSLTDILLDHGPEAAVAALGIAFPELPEPGAPGEVGTLEDALKQAATEEGGADKVLALFETLWPEFNIMVVS
jgi:hypothetical protein